MKIHMQYHLAVQIKIILERYSNSGHTNWVQLCQIIIRLIYVIIDSQWSNAYVLGLYK